MVTKLGTIWFCLLSSATLLTVNADGKPEAIKTSVCKVIARPDFYDAKIISMRAAVRGSGIHALHLKDFRCLNAQEIVIGEAEHNHRLHLQELMDAVSAAYRDSTSARRMHVEATFTGIFRHHSRDLPDPELLLIDVTSIRSVEGGSLAPEMPAAPKKWPHW